jgi:hypothetical protein
MKTSLTDFEIQSAAGISSLSHQAELYLDNSTFTVATIIKLLLIYVFLNCWVVLNPA